MKEQGDYKFQKLRVYKLALEYVDAIYGMSEGLPGRERYNLQNQLERAVISIALNIAEGSTGQTNAEQRRFLGHALRSYLETKLVWIFFREETMRPCWIFSTRGNWAIACLSSYRRSGAHLTEGNDCPQSPVLGHM